MSNTQNKQDVENKASLNKEDEAFVKFDDEQTEKKMKIQLMMKSKRL